MEKKENTKFKIIMILLSLFILSAIIINIKLSKAFAQSEKFDVILYDNVTGEYIVTVSVDLDLYPKEEYIYVIEKGNPSVASSIGFIKKQSTYRAGNQYTLSNITYKKYFYSYPDGNVSNNVGTNIIKEGYENYDYYKFSEDIYITENANGWVNGEQFARANLDITKWENGKTFDTKTMSIIGEDIEYQVKSSDIPISWISVGKFQYPNYLFIKKDGRYYFVTSENPYYIDITTGYTHITGKTIIYEGGVDIDNEKIIWFKDFENISAYTKLLTGITTTDILYNSADIMDTDVWPQNAKESTVSANTTNTIMLSENILGDVVSNNKNYVYSADIPSVQGIQLIAKKRLWNTSKTLYDLTWVKQKSDYQIEIKAYFSLKDKTTKETTFSDTKIAQDVYNVEPWFSEYIGTYRVFDDMQYFTHDLSKQSLYACKALNREHEGFNKDLKIELYFIRYVKATSDSILYGNWQVVAIKYSDNILKGIETYAIEEVQEAGLIINPETGQEEMSYIPVDGTLKGGLDPNDRDLIYEPSELDINYDLSLTDATNTIKNVGGWLGELPSLLSAIFAFLPFEILALLGLGVSLLIILRIVGR